MQRRTSACTYQIAFGPREGKKVLTVQGVMPGKADFKKDLCADLQGFSLHASVRFDAGDRNGLEQLRRTIARSALATGGWNEATRARWC